MVAYATGTATDEQNLASLIDTFLTSTIGTWTKIDTIANTATDKDYIFYSVGTDPSRYGPYIRVKGHANYLKLYGYSSWNATTHIGLDEISHASNYTWVNVGSSTIPYWLFGTQDWFWVVGKNGASYYSGFAGNIVSYYSPSDDPKPIAVVGHSSNTYDMSSTRCYMHATPQLAASGTIANYVAANTVYSTLLTNGAPNARDSSVAHQPIILKTTLAGFDELRGELPGILHFHGAGTSAEQWVIISGTGDKYFIQRNNATTQCWGLGPVPV